jgi:copper chaperone
MAITEYRVSGMSCGHCEAAVTEEVQALDGVESVEVSAATGRLVIDSSVELDDASVLAAVDEAGYAAERVS